MKQEVDLTGKLPIRIDFEGAEAKKFRILKRHLGLRQNTEVIRVLISEKYNEMLLLEERRLAKLVEEARALEWLKHGESKFPM